MSEVSFQVLEKSLIQANYLSGYHLVAIPTSGALKFITAEYIAVARLDLTTNQTNKICENFRGCLY